MDLRRLTSNDIPAWSRMFLTLSVPTSNVIVTAYQRAHGTLLPPVREHLPKPAGLFAQPERACQLLAYR